MVTKTRQNPAGDVGKVGLRVEFLIQEDTYYCGASGVAMVKETPWVVKW